VNLNSPNIQVNTIMEQTGFKPLGDMMEIGTQRKKLLIGVPKECDKYENRVCLTPEAVENLTNSGHKVFLEKGAGLRADFTDLQYAERGAIIVNSPKEVYQAEFILKVSPPTEFEIDLMTERQILFSSLHLMTQTTERIQKMMRKHIYAVAFEHLKSGNDYYPVVNAMSEISGSSAILIAAEYLNNESNGKGILLGGITGVTPAEVVIIGASAAGLYAAKTAIGLGALVKIFDNSVIRLQHIKHFLGQNVYTSIIHPQVIERALITADAVIGALPYSENYAYVVNEDTVRKMKEGAVIVDMNVDKSPCFETSIITNLGNPVYRKLGVIHYCVPNIPSRVAKTASIALSNVFVPLIESITENGGIENLLRKEMGLRKGTYIYQGILTNHDIGSTFGLPSKNIDLLIASF